MGSPQATEPGCGAEPHSNKIDALLEILRCPGCSTAPLARLGAAVACGGCGARYPLRDGVLDMTALGRAEVITPFQRLMQSPAVVGVYERYWRPLGYRAASGRPFADELRAVLGLLDGCGGKRVLDLACGPGVFTRPLARQGSGLVVGLDLSWPMLLHARRAAESEGLRNLVFVRGSAFRLPFVASAFSTIACCGALHLFDDPEAALGEIRRALGRSGCLAVQTTIRPARLPAFAFLLERFIRFGFFEEDVLVEMLRRQGLRVVERERHRISMTLLARGSD